MAHILLCGLGDLGQRVARSLCERGHQVSALRRRAEAPDGVEVFPQQLGQEPVQLPAAPVDLVYIIMAPDERTEAAYRDAYIRAPIAVLDALAVRGERPPALFVSSTAVYGADQGEVDELTAPAPDGFNGRVLLEAETAVFQRTTAVAVRLSGLYGPDSVRLLRQVQQLAAEGAALPAPVWSHRIHRDDAAALLAALGEARLAGQALPPVVIGTDPLPVSNHEVLHWLASELGLTLPPAAAPAGKRLHSRYLAVRPVAWRYPDYRAGYRPVLERFRNGELS